ncbi:MAG TPA: hypothetical protein VJ583_03330 [Nitrososphaeraceae archaeon]|nr:hypothetical protein [Nitrososphaeraceae archaeon]
MTHHFYSGGESNTIKLSHANVHIGRYVQLGNSDCQEMISEEIIKIDV